MGERIGVLNIDDALDSTQMTDLIAGAVGEGLAVKFQAHRKIASKLPMPEDILNGKVKKLNTKEISLDYGDILIFPSIIIL